MERIARDLPKDWFRALAGAWIPALVFGIIQLFRKGDQQMPFGPSLAVGILATALGWQWVPLFYRALFFEWWLVAGLGGAAILFLFVMAVLLRLVRGKPEPEGTQA